MSKHSDAIKAWRNRTKERALEAMGGKCVCCGYMRCARSLAFHHLDPSGKDFSLGQVRANPASWAAIVSELRKCVLVCHNCHNEIHDGMTEVPIDAARFNEEFAEYESLLKTSSPVLLGNCATCGKAIQLPQKSCSYACSSKRKYKVDWDSIDLAAMLLEKTYTQLAEEFGCSDAAIHKRMLKLGLKERSNRKRQNVND